MSDMENMGARMVSQEPTARQRQETEEAALDAFMSLNAPGSTTRNMVAMGAGTIWGVQRRLAEHINGLLQKMLEDDLVDDEDMDIISEHLSRRLADAHSACDNLHRIHDELLCIDLNSILTRYKGAQ